ncbi:putative ABC transporter ATP-binding protein [bioreactor metagenome]|uniref:Putative ABC transporter ATP-binding protein n=1 Tax=bioreactor metagenome TaxID=1076179 RepID=A0A644SVK4_9ZZZZ|nr:ABC transporter ATP-binding protein [Methanobrevibacter sp.]MEA4956436.1 ABC transporter ATP-binding protein [Methanobrevibacter sp.]
MDKILEIKNASFSYDDEKNVFEDINFSISKGDVLCILGPNGTGKTTLLKSLNGLNHLKEGEVFLKGKSLKSLSFKEIAKIIGYIPQGHIPTFPFSVLDVILMGRSPYLGLTESPGEKDIKIAMNVLKNLNISHMANREYTNLSGGEKQLVFLARVLAQEPDLLILDEPTSHLDFGNQIRFLEIIDALSKKGLTIIMSSHFPDHAFISSNKVAIMKDKHLIDFGTPKNVITEKSLKFLYNIDLELLEISENRKICVPIKSNSSFNFNIFSE